MRVNPNYTPELLSSLWNVEQQEQNDILELTTGRRVNEPSDDPAAAAADVENQAAQSQNDQYEQNTTDLEGMFQTAQSTISSVVTALNQAISIGTEGANSGLSSSNLQTMTGEVQDIQKQVVSLANTSYEGAYLFAGTANTQPFTLDSSQASGVQYNGNSETNTVAIADGSTMQSNVSGSQLFLGSSGSVMGSLQQLVTALQSGNSTSIGDATTAVSTALNYLSQGSGFYNSGLSQLDSNQTFLQQETVNLKTQDNSLVGVDEATAATDLSQAETAQSASLAAIAKVIPQSLLNYLQ
jgi:flagellar hook-associated protein 3 FlgL